MTALDLYGPTYGRLTNNDFVGEPKITMSDPDILINTMGLYYDYTGWGFSDYYEINRNNNAKCQDSYFLNGATPRAILKLTDIADKTTAVAAGLRQLAWKAFRHDMLECLVPYYKGFGIQIGDKNGITLAEGADRHGNGWEEEPLICLEKIYRKNDIYFKWWRIADR